MEFTQIHELNNLIRLNREESRYKVNKQPQKTTDTHIAEKTVDIIKDILTIREPSHKIAADLDLYAMSYYSQIPQIQQTNTPLISVSDRITSKSELPNVDEWKLNQNNQIFSMESIMSTNNTRRSSLNGRLSSILQLKKSNAFEKKIYRVKVYFFGTKTNKIIQYSNDTLAETILKKALSEYLCDKSLDHSLIKSISKQAYNLFLCDTKSHLHDEDLDPINLKKKIKDFNADSIVLMKDSSFGEKSEQSLAENIKVEAYDRKSITVINQHGEEILKLNMDKDAVIALIYEKIEKMGPRYVEDKFYLSVSEDVIEDSQISRDTIVNQLPNTLFVRIKRYADEAVIPQERKPSEDADVEDIQAPMGLAQASMYQQFRVIKINRRGIRQERILGIDQIKLYNYDKQIRKEDKEVGFFSKVFSNINIQFGTKTPQRLISDIIGISEVASQNILRIQFSNVFSSKSLQFEVEFSIRKRIMQKLRVLTSCQQNKI